MKLKDFVFNSLRGRDRAKSNKKKTAPVTRSGLEADIGCFGRDSGKHWFPPSLSRSRSRERGSVGADYACRADWQGNVLYRGLGQHENEADVKYRLVNQSSRTKKGHSQNGFVQQFNASCEECDIEYISRDPYCYACQYDQPCYGVDCSSPNRTRKGDQYFSSRTKQSVSKEKSGTYKLLDSPKTSKNFFRKSLDSLRGMRKLGSRNKVFNKQQQGADWMACPLCSDSENTPPGSWENSSEDRNPKVKKKHKFSKKADCKDKCQSRITFDNNLITDTDKSATTTPRFTRARLGPLLSKHERSLLPRCPVELWPAGHGHSLEEAVSGDLKLATFESESVSGYESDVSRGRLYSSSRSRIKTNPWLPSPQPSLEPDYYTQNLPLRMSSRRSTSSSNRNLKFIKSPTTKTHSSFHDNQGKFNLNANENLTSCLASPRSSNENKHHSGLTSPLTSTLYDRRSRASVRKLRNQASVIHNVPLNDLSATISSSQSESCFSIDSQFFALTSNIEQLTQNITACRQDSNTNSTSPYRHRSNSSSYIPCACPDGDEHVLISYPTGSDHTVKVHTPDSGIGLLGCTEGEVSPSGRQELKSSSATINSRYNNARTSISPFSQHNTSYSLAITHPLSQHDTSYSLAAAPPHLRVDQPRSCCQGRHSRLEHVCDCTRDNQRCHEPYIRSQSSHLMTEDPLLSISALPMPDTQFINSRRCLNRMDHSQLSTIYSCAFVNDELPTGPMKQSRTTYPVFLHDSELGYAEIRKSKPSRVSSIPSHSDQAPGENRRTCMEAVSYAGQSCLLRTEQDIVSITPTPPRVTRTRADCEQVSLLPSELDFPRNITVTACMESPTENWECDSLLDPLPYDDAHQHALSDIQPNSGHMEQNKHDPRKENLFCSPADCGICSDFIISSFHSKPNRASFSRTCLDEDRTKARQTIVGHSTTDVCVQTDFDDEEDEAGDGILTWNELHNRKDHRIIDFVRHPSTVDVTLAEVVYTQGERNVNTERELTNEENQKSSSWQPEREAMAELYLLEDFLLSGHASLHNEATLVHLIQEPTNFFPDDSAPPMFLCPTTEDDMRHKGFRTSNINNCYKEPEVEETSTNKQNSSFNLLTAKTLNHELLQHTSNFDIRTAANLDKHNRLAVKAGFVPSESEPGLVPNESMHATVLNSNCTTPESAASTAATSDPPSVAPSQRENRVNQMFHHIENLFQEIFQQIESRQTRRKTRGTENLSQKPRVCSSASVANALSTKPFRLEEIFAIDNNETNFRSQVNNNLDMTPAIRNHEIENKSLHDVPNKFSNEMSFDKKLCLTPQSKLCNTYFQDVNIFDSRRSLAIDCFTLITLSNYTIPRPIISSACLSNLFDSWLDNCARSLSLATFKPLGLSLNLSTQSGTAMEIRPRNHFSLSHSTSLVPALDAAYCAVIEEDRDCSVPSPTVTISSSSYMDALICSHSMAAHPCCYYCDDNDVHEDSRKLQASLQQEQKTSITVSNNSKALMSTHSSQHNDSFGNTQIALLCDDSQTNNRRLFLPEKVQALCQERDVIFQKIHQAQEDERVQENEQVRISQDLRSKRKELLLPLLSDMRRRLSARSKPLNPRTEYHASLDFPFGLLEYVDFR